MTPLESTLVAVLSALCSAAVGIIASVHGRNAQREANSIDRFEALTTAHENRIGDLERELTLIKQALSTEQTEHSQTRWMLKAAMRYVRDLTNAWGAAVMPAAPDLLAPELW